MNALVITADANVLREGSAAASAILEYEKLGSHVAVVVLNTRRNPYRARKVSDTLWVLPVNAWALWLAPLSAFRVIRRELFFQGHLQSDVISAHDPWLAGLTGWLVARRFGKPLQMVLNDDVLSQRYGRQSLSNLFARILANFVVRRSDALYVTSESARAALADISDSLADRAVMARRVVDVAAIQNEPQRVDLHAKYPEYKFIMLVVAPLLRSQNIALAISALAGVLRLYPHAGLVVVGEGRARRSLKAFSSRLGISDRVAFEGWNDNLVSYYRTADVFLVTAPYEAYDDTIACAAASGCPIISTRVGIAPDVITDNESGFLCDATDVDRFTADTVLLIRKPVIRNKLKLNALTAIEDYMKGDPAERFRLYQVSLENAIKAREKPRF